jgi:hypothetical protein
MGHRGKAKGAGRKAIWVISSRSLRSAQARKRVPGLASPSLGHYATLSFIVRGRGPENFGLGIGHGAQGRKLEVGGRKRKAQSLFALIS